MAIAVGTQPERTRRNSSIAAITYNAHTTQVNTQHSFGQLDPDIVIHKTYQNGNVWMLVYSSRAAEKNSDELD